MLRTLTRHDRRTFGFTILELVVVVIILGLLAAIAVPQFIERREAAWRAAAAAVLKDAGTFQEVGRTVADTYVPNVDGGVSGTNLTDFGFNETQDVGLRVESWNGTTYCMVAWHTASPAKTTHVIANQPVTFDFDGNGTTEADETNVAGSQVYFLGDGVDGSDATWAGGTITSPCPSGGGGGSVTATPGPSTVSLSWTDTGAPSYTWTCTDAGGHSASGTTSSTSADAADLWDGHAYGCTVDDGTSTWTTSSTPDSPPHGSDEPSSPDAFDPQPADDSPGNLEPTVEEPDPTNPPSSGTPLPAEAPAPSVRGAHALASFPSGHGTYPHNLYVTYPDLGDVVVVRQTALAAATPYRLSSAFTTPTGIVAGPDPAAADRQVRVLYVAEESDGTIWQLNATHGTRAQVGSGFSAPQHLAGFACYDAGAKRAGTDVCLYVTDATGVHQLDVGTGTVSTFSTAAEVAGAYGIVGQDTGSPELVVGHGAEAPQLSMAGADNGDLVTGRTDVRGLAWMGGAVLGADNGTDEVRDLTNGTVITSSVTGPTDVHFHGNAGTVYVTDDNGCVWDVDTGSGTASQLVCGTNSLSLVSRTSSGAVGDNQSVNADVSDDGRYVVFESTATNFSAPPDATGQFDVFRHDTVTGSVTKLSWNSMGAESDGSSQSPAISGDGQYVAFHSAATDLIATDTNGTVDVFRKSVGGLAQRVSVSSSGAQANGASYNAALSDDGRYVAFQSAASNLVAGDTNGVNDIFVRDTVAGTTTRVSVDSGGTQGNQASTFPAISGDGRYVAFESNATNLVAGDTNGDRDVFVHDTVTGTTTRVSVSTTGVQGNNISTAAAISDDGRYVAFLSLASDMVAGDTNGQRDAFRHDTVTGTTVRVSVDSSGSQANGRADAVDISDDGRIVTFDNRSSNLVASDTNGTTTDVFTKDLLTGVTTLVSRTASGAAGNGNSRDPRIAGDGRSVVFDSRATNFATLDTNAASDVFRVRR